MELLKFYSILLNELSSPFVFGWLIAVAILKAVLRTSQKTWIVR